MNRRKFLQQAGLTLGVAATQWTVGGCTGNRPACTAHDGEGATRGVTIVFDPADPVASAAPAQWAVGQLRDALTAKGIAVNVAHRIDDVPSGFRCVLAAGKASADAARIVAAAAVSFPDSPESVLLARAKNAKRDVLLAGGSDVRGVVYALTDIADAVTHADDARTALNLAGVTIERPANSVRSVMRVFASDVEDKGWFNDQDFWRRYLSMLAAQRFNRFNLALGVGYDFARNLRDTYFYFAYPFLLNVAGYNVRASGLAAAERDQNLKMLQFISSQCAARGMHFQLGIWTHAYQWTDSPGVNHTIEGLTPRTHAAYCRDALKELLQACPSIAGVTFRIHGESGVAEGNYDFWKTVFDGVAQCGRAVEIDMHAKGIDPTMIDIALATAMPVKVSPKRWAEHMGLPYHQAAIRSLELPKAAARDNGFFSKSSGSRSFLRYGYGDLLREDRRYGVLHRMWPGTQRLLLWGDPQTAAAYGRTASFCGSVGMELFEPLSFKGRKGSGLPGGRNAYADETLKPDGGDWKKHAYTYRLWGRLLYNPDANPEIWRRSLRTEFGPSAAPVESAFANASRILPLVTTAHCPSAANYIYWPEMYTNMPIVDPKRPHPYGDSPTPRRFGTVSPLDPQLFSRIDDFADELLAGKPSGKYTPAEVAAWLDQLAGSASRELTNAEAQARDRKDPHFRRMAIDVAILSGLGHFFAGKLRAGVLFALHTRTGDANLLNEALKAYRAARDVWAAFASRASESYVRDITFGWDAYARGNWSNRLPAIDQDIADMQSRLDAKADVSNAAIDHEKCAALLAAVLAPSDRPNIAIEHLPPSSFQRGQAVELTLRLAKDLKHVPALRIYYRRVNQAEAYQTADINRRDESTAEFVATIPAQYTDSLFPLQYYFELRDATGKSWLFPGLNRYRNNQPYFVLRPRA